MPTEDTATAIGILAEDLFGYPSLRPGQLDSMNQVLAGGNCVVLLPTGAGKSLIYQLTGLLRPGATIVVDPIVSLIDDQERRLRSDGIDRVDAMHSSRLAGQRDEVFSRLASGETLFALVTPERFQSADFRRYLREAASAQLINLAVIDEAHCVSEWGHDFRTSYLRLGRNLREYSKGTDDVEPPVLALTGTASPAVLNDVLRELAIDGTAPGTLQRPNDFDRANLDYAVVATDPSGYKAELELAVRKSIPASLKCEPEDLARVDGENTLSGIVFVPNVNGDFGVQNVKAAVSSALRAADAVDIYSGGKPSNFAGSAADWNKHKVEAAERFKTNEVPVLISTKAFGMGIDKPNIRWTIHLGMPSSIEAFAQEAGRSGRDGRTARCVLVAVHPLQARADELLDRSITRQERHRRWQENKWAKDDLQKQFYFLFNSFPNKEVERAGAIDIWAELQAAGGAPQRQVALVRLPASFARARQDKKDEVVAQREKALYRLALVGVVSDYTVDHGANTFTVQLAAYGAATIDELTLSYVDRVEPGRARSHRAAIDASPADIGDRIESHIELVLSVLYRVIEPARFEALRSIYDLTCGAKGDADIRREINEYLSDGPVAKVLTSALAEPIFDVGGLLRVLDATPPSNASEWAFAASRQMESFGLHPALLVVRVLGEAWKAADDGVESSFNELARSLFASLPEYDVSVGDGRMLLEWMLVQLRNQQQGRRWGWAAGLWQAWDAGAFPDISLEALEDRVLRAAGPDAAFHPAELGAVAFRRVRRAAVQAKSFTDTRTAQRSQP